MDCFASLAMTGDTASRSRGALRPRFASNSPALSKSEGAGNAGCALHPRSRAQESGRLRARAYRAAENIRHSLRNGFTGRVEERRGDWGHAPSFRFRSPLIEPDMRISRIRLSDKHSCLRPRQVTRQPRQPNQSPRLGEILVWIAIKPRP